MRSFGETKDAGGLAVQDWDVATGTARGTSWAPVDPKSDNAGVFFASLSRDGRLVAWGGGVWRDNQHRGTAEVWEVRSLGPSPPRIRR
jgi:hypothetical protein